MYFICKSQNIFVPFHLTQKDSNCNHLHLHKEKTNKISKFWKLYVWINKLSLNKINFDYNIVAVLSPIPKISSLAKTPSHQ